MAIEITNLTVKFKNGTVGLDHLTVQISNGIFGLLGENGAGKTTLMRVIATLLVPTSGTVQIDGVPLTPDNYNEIRKIIGYLPQELDLYPNLTILETLEYMGRLSGLSKGEAKKRTTYLLERTNLQDHQHKKIRQLSGGMKRRVGLAQALINNPSILIVDEPTTGLDPEERIRIRNLLVEFSNNRTVIFSTHVVEDLALTCRNLVVMKQGHFLFIGDTSDLINKAKNHIWNYSTDNQESLQLGESGIVVSSIPRPGQGMNYRIVSEDKPFENCIPETPSLEDAYIYISNIS